jgi:pilus assembly protein CpaB
MNLKTWIPLALAVVLGLIAAKVARDTIVRSRSAGQGPGRTVKIVIVAKPVSPGQELTADVLALGPIVAEAPPRGAFTDAAAVVGRVAATEMFPGQPVMDSLLAGKGSGAGLQALVPRGMRAVTVEVNETSGVAGLIAPGCHVDVVTTLNGASKQETVAVIVVQDVLVQAVGQRMTSARNPDEKEPPPVRNVTLIATPREVEAIQLASSTGSTRLVLRGANDRGLHEDSGLTFLDLWRDEDHLALPADPVTPVTPVPPVVEAPVATTRPSDPIAQDPFKGETPRPRRTVALIRGGVRSEVVFDQPAEPSASRSEQAVTSTNEGGGQQ